MNLRTLLLLAAVTPITNALPLPATNNRDPFLNTDYQQAFDQKALWHTHQQTLYQENREGLLSDPPQVYKSQLQSPKSETSKKLDKLLGEDFLRKKADQAYQPFLNDAASVVFYAATTALILHTASFIFPSSIVDTGKGCWIYVVAEQIAHTINEGFRKRFKIKTYKGDPLRKYELQYAANKRFISADLWEGIESRFLAARSNSYARQAHIEFFETLFSLPTQNAPAVNQDRTTLFANFVKEMRIYFGETYQDQREVHKISSAFWNHISNNPQLSEKRPLFLLGPGGVGKTTVVEHLAQRLNVPLIVINISQAQNAQDLFGSKEKPGILLQRLTSCPHKNAVLFFDEASDVLNDGKMSALLKALFEPDQCRFESLYLGMEIDVSGYLMIAAGNSAISDAALASRFVMMNYPNFAQSFLRNHAYQVLLPKMFHSGIHIRCLEDLHSDERVELDKIITRCETPRDLINEIGPFFHQIESKRS